MADQDKPAFYPRVGNIRPKKQVSPLQQVIQRNMEELSRGPELPQWGDMDLSVPTAANRQMSQRLTEEEQRQRQQAMSNLSPLEKLAAAMQAARVAGSGLVQGIASMPTELMQGPEAAQKQMIEGMYKPTIPQAYDYLEEALDPINKVVEATKLPGVMPEIATIGMIPRELASAQARSLMGRGVNKAEGAITPFVNRTMEQGGKGAELLGALTQGSRSNVIKPKGGNWLTGDVEKAIEPLKSKVTTENFVNYTPEQVERMVGSDRIKRNDAINKWIDSNLTNYIKKEMATPEDPVRKLAEQGITHKSDLGDFRTSVGTTVQQKREKAGFPVEGMGQSDLAKRWENLADYSFGSRPAKDVSSARYPWVSKLDPETRVYGGYHNLGNRQLGFDHIIDVLKEDLATGRIRPEQLSKVSMEQAVRRTYEYDQEMAKKMREAAIKQTEGMPVHKEYPEGYKWIELSAPDFNKLPIEERKQLIERLRIEAKEKGVSPEDYIEKYPESLLSQALKYEGETMGHCVGGYCPDVMSGRSRIFSLRDAKGEPHVTVEVEPAPNIGFRAGEGPATPEERFDLQSQWMKETESGKVPDTMTFATWWRQKNGIPEPERPVQISQIKGKQNAAPKEQYLPYVQDFVRGGQWSDVRDLQNTGLRDMNRYEPLRKYLEGKGTKFERYIPEEEFKGHEDDFLMDRLYPKDDPDYAPPIEGMKRGGSVHISDNSDTQMMELAGGGLTKLAKLARAPAKSKEEIRAVAERMAPQMTGEFVRGEKGTQSVAGKTQKQFAREKELQHDIRGEMPVPGTIDYEKLKDQVAIGIAGDPTITGKSVHGVAGEAMESPSPQHGGPLYGLGRDDVHFWASQLGAAKRVQNLAREAGQQYDMPVLGQYIMMGPESINYAQHFADANLSAINPAKMTKRQIEGFNKLIRQGSQASGPRPGFPGIENKDEAYLQMAIDPELRKHFNALMQMPTVTEKFNLPSGIDVRHAVTEPALRDLETGVTGYSVGQMKPEVTELQLSSHPTYSHDIPGHFLGQSKYPIPYEIMFPDTLKAIRENPKQAPHEFGSLKMVGPRQQIDQQLIDEIKMYEEMVKSLTGKAGGGAVTSAALKAMERLKELKAEAALKADVWKAKQAADEAKYTQDIQPMTPEMMKAEIERMQNPVKKAAGGEITADDLILEERPL